MRVFRAVFHLSQINQLPYKVLCPFWEAQYVFIPSEYNKCKNSIFYVFYGTISVKTAKRVPSNNWLEWLATVKLCHFLPYRVTVLAVFGVQKTHRSFTRFLRVWAYFDVFLRVLSATAFRYHWHPPFRGAVAPPKSGWMLPRAHRKVAWQCIDRTFFTYARLVNSTKNGHQMARNAVRALKTSKNCFRRSLSPNEPLNGELREKKIFKFVEIFCSLWRKQVSGDFIPWIFLDFNETQMAHSLT